MKLHFLTVPAIVALCACTLQSANADDKKKMLEWQLQQQQLTKQWKLQEVQRQQQLLQQHQQTQKKRAVIVAAARPWGLNQNGRGSMAFTGAAPDRLNFVVVTLNNFYNAAGAVNNSGSASITVYGNYAYPFAGTWSAQGNLTVGLNLTPSANAVRGDRATGNLTMSPPSGQSVSHITLTGTMSGNPFTANFAGQ